MSLTIEQTTDKLNKELKKLEERIGILQYSIDSKEKEKTEQSNKSTDKEIADLKIKMEGLEAEMKGLIEKLKKSKRDLEFQLYEREILIASGDIDSEHLDNMNKEILDTKKIISEANESIARQKTQQEELARMKAKAAEASAQVKDQQTTPALEGLKVTVPEVSKKPVEQTPELDPDMSLTIEQTTDKLNKELKELEEHIRILQYSIDSKEKEKTEQSNKSTDKEIADLKIKMEGLEAEMKGLIEKLKKSKRDLEFQLYEREILIASGDIDSEHLDNMDKEILDTKKIISEANESIARQKTQQEELARMKAKAAEASAQVKDQQTTPAPAVEVPAASPESPQASESEVVVTPEWTPMPSTTVVQADIGTTQAAELLHKTNLQTLLAIKASKGLNAQPQEPAVPLAPPLTAAVPAAVPVAEASNKQAEEVNEALRGPDGNGGIKANVEKYLAQYAFGKKKKEGASIGNFLLTANTNKKHAGMTKLLELIDKAIASKNPEDQQAARKFITELKNENASKFTGKFSSLGQVDRILGNAEKQLQDIEKKDKLSPKT